jgi:hypothetical protein
MDLVKVLESVDEFIYEIALWLLLVPRTFLQVVFRPAWACAYVDAELKKDKSQRFSDYLSPVLFWVVVGLIPYFCVLGLLSSIKASTVASEAGFRYVLSMGWQNQLLVIAGFGLGLPLEFSRRTVKALGQTVNRESLRRPFYTQCFCVGPAYLILLPALTITLRFDDKIPPGPMTMLFGASWSLFGIWLLYAESAILQTHLGKSRAKAVGLTISFFLSSFFLVLVLELLVITLVYPQAWWEP